MLLRDQAIERWFPTSPKQCLCTTWRP